MNQTVVGVAHRVTKHQARRAFHQGETIAVSARGHETTFNIFPSTTVHDSSSTDWDTLEQQVNDWSNRYPNQRYYIVTKPIERIAAGVAAGWRVVYFSDGSIERMTVTKLQQRHGINAL